MKNSTFLCKFQRSNFLNNQHVSVTLIKIYSFMNQFSYETELLIGMPTVTFFLVTFDLSS